MYKLFINNKVVFLCQNPAAVDNLMNGEFIIEPYTTKNNLEALLNIILSDVNKSDIIVFHKDVQKLFDDFCSYFKCITAAGGVVLNAKQEVLLIYRRGSWDLPKGKIDKGETIEQAAIREVEEETGIQDVRIVKPLTFGNVLNTATYHSYFLNNGELALKVSYWFLMESTYTKDLTPQSEEDIEQAVWVKQENIPDYFDNMYPSVIDVLKTL